MKLLKRVQLACRLTTGYNFSTALAEWSHPDPQPCADLPTEISP